MNAKDATNAPVSIELAGKKYKIREAGVLKVKASIQASILEEKTKKIQKIAALLPEKDQTKYIIEKAEKLPEGAELDKLAVKALTDGDVSMDTAMIILHDAMEQDQPSLTIDDVGKIYMEADSASRLLALRTALGSKKGSARAGKRSRK